MAGLVIAQDVESRLRTLEDRLEIYELLASYGPAVDSRDQQRVGELWSANGTYTFDDVKLAGPEVAGLVHLESHTALVNAGCGHVLSLPAIEVHGDEAVAVNYSIVFLHGTEAWTPARVSANRWELAREPSGWRVVRRVNALLDGRALPRELLSRTGPEASLVEPEAG